MISSNIIAIAAMIQLTSLYLVLSRGKRINIALAEATTGMHGRP